MSKPKDAPPAATCEEIEARESLIRRMAIELEYIQAVENCESGLCATSLGKSLIEEAEKMLGEMKSWPEILNQ